jgi:NIMA (never in mitosis gene a)-related kinase
VSYKHSFIEKGILIIIMEFCEHGDLAYHVRKKKQKDERFSETEIMNWFVQLCLSLEYVHSRKILHRDLKTSNIFLTKDNTVKLGDFGISKVLECTQDHAMTVQGTPYYMSPEVCQNKPYTYQSDIWALGCILYELCNLKHAFHAENLLGLVFKIVQDKQEPVDGDYSDELKEIIDMLLTKDEKARPRVIDIINRPFVKQHMERFVKSAGKNNLNPQLGKKKTI